MAPLTQSDLRGYLIVTGGYWGFTITDGAIRMLVVLYFHLLGYSPLEVAMLFLFYEFFGIVTNLVGGWLGTRLGLNRTMHIGMGLQVLALAMLTVPDPWLSVGFVMCAQALSGIAKDLNKMSAKASVKTLAGADGSGRLLKWVAMLTGSKNALKGLGFFLGAALLELVSFRGAMGLLAGGLAIVLVLTAVLAPRDLGKATDKPKFTEVFSRTPAVNWLSAARFFLFASRDVWFVVALPMFLYSTLGWSFMQVGATLAFWIIGYGIVQAGAPKLLRSGPPGRPGPGAAQAWAAALVLCPAALAFGIHETSAPGVTILVGLGLFGVVFAVNSSLHSYLILAYSDFDKVSMNVGFYYMANAGGRLAGTILSGLGYQLFGLSGCLWIAAGFVAATTLISLKLPPLPALRTASATPD